MFIPAIACPCSTLPLLVPRTTRIPWDPLFAFPSPANRQARYLRFLLMNKSADVSFSWTSKSIPMKSTIEKSSCRLCKKTLCNLMGYIINAVVLRGQKQALDCLNHIILCRRLCTQLPEELKILKPCAG